MALPMSVTDPLQPTEQLSGWGAAGAPLPGGPHQRLLAIALDSRDAPCDFDLGALKLTVTYQVLQ